MQRGIVKAAMAEISEDRVDLLEEKMRAKIDTMTGFSDVEAKSRALEKVRTNRARCNHDTSLSELNYSLQVQVSYKAPIYAVAVKRYHARKLHRFWLPFNALPPGPSMLPSMIKSKRGFQ